MSEAEHLARLKAMHDRVHRIRDSNPPDPLYRVFIDGAEMMMDWVLGQCPDGDFDEDWDPLAANCPWRIVLVHDVHAGTDRIDGDVFVVRGDAQPRGRPMRSPRSAPSPPKGELPMPTRRTDAERDAQLALVPLTAEELKAAGPKLARLIRELEDLEEEHKESRSEQSAERKKVRGKITSLAGQIRSQGR